MLRKIAINNDDNCGFSSHQRHQDHNAQRQRTRKTQKRWRIEFLTASSVYLICCVPRLGERIYPTEFCQFDKGYQGFNVLIREGARKIYHAFTYCCKCKAKGKDFERRSDQSLNPGLPAWECINRFCSAILENVSICKRCLKVKPKRK